jgi:signal transduction histidine kinase/ligand-binding sensor domain-containing protein/DNA-binding response OmpR family regulator
MQNIKATILIFLFFYTSILHAQTGAFKFSHLDISKGLSNNQITCIYKDSKGFLWFGTMSGLNRFDGYTFKVFRHDLRDTTSINDNYIYKITEDREGRLWINTHNGFAVLDTKTETFKRDYADILQKLEVPFQSITGIFRDNMENIWFLQTQEGLAKIENKSGKTSVIKHLANDTNSLYSHNISDIATDNMNNTWIIHQNGVLERMDEKTGKINYRNYALKGNTLLTYNLFIDNENDLWIFSNLPEGLYYFKASDKTIFNITQKSKTWKLNNNNVRGIVQDNNGILWIGTDHGGINLLDKNKNEILHLLNSPDDETSLAQNSITSLYKDKAGIIWVGTFKKGISYFHENIVRFKHLKNQINNTKSLSFDDVNCFAEDNLGNLWIGTNGGGLLYYNRAKETFTQYKHSPANPYSISNDVIVSLFIDHKKRLWIGTYFGGLNYFENNRFYHFKHKPQDPASLSDDRVWYIFEDSRKQMWIGTLGGGLDLFDREKKIFKHYKVGDSASVHSNFIISIIEDREKKLWIGMAYGIDVFDPKTGQFTHILQNNNTGSLSNNNIITIMEDSRGFIWVGTREGLNLYDRKTKTFRVFREDEGLPDNTILTLVEDNNRNLWISTPNGISNLVITHKPNENEYSFFIKNYDESDGLQGKEFNEKAAFKTNRGEIIFGGANGLNIFKPEEIKINVNTPTIVFTDLQIFNKSIKVNERVEGRIILNRAIADTKEITLKHSENIISIEFAALSYIHPEKNKYSYMLEGFNKTWITTDSKVRKATYTNLDPGEYTFRVKASNNDDFWNEEGISLKITILPPFWRTKTAFLLYFLTIASILMLSRRILLDRARMKFNLEQERIEAQRLHELDMLKIKFFTNISHEFRTPLTLIITPIEKLLKNAKEPDLQKQYTMIYRNAWRLLNLVNQLLDFRRMEVQEFKLNPAPAEIISFIKSVTYSFSDLSEKKNINLSVTTNIKEFITSFDQDKLEKILFNLLSNAFKFTPERGSITVDVKVVEQENIAATKEKFIQIKVTDTGIGIAKDKHEKIFERFFQNDIPGNMVNQGSGIGLALTKEFVKLHNGTVTLESEPEKGSCFTVWIPAIESAEADLVTPPITENISINPDVHKGERIAFEKDSKKAMLLLVEDNDDFRFYLKDNLKAFYNITEARNGEEGLNLAFSFVPDLIVSDVMMPVMDGMELCKKVKTDKRTSHIPVILLTAKGGDDQKLEGFETGADDYIIKPFNFEILQSRIKNLISQRDSMRKAFVKKVEIEPSEITVTPLDEKLIRKAIDLVEKNISNPDFSVEELSRELGMSRVHLYKKLLSITGKTPIEFIRTIRLKRAAQLLKKSQLTVSEIAYQVGFNNPKYFTKYFKAEYNVLPSQFVNIKD